MKALVKLLRRLVTGSSNAPRLALGLKHPERLGIHLARATEPAIGRGLGRPLSR